MFDAFSDRVFTFNGRTGNATAIDAATDKVVGTVDIGGKPEFAVTDGKGTIFVNNEDTSEIVVFDAKSLEVKKRWSIAPGEGPSGLAIDLKNKRLFSVCDAVMVVSDYENGKVVTTVPIGGGPDAVRYDAGAGLVFASNGEGTLTVVKQDSADKYTVLETVPTARGARTMVARRSVQSARQSAGLFQSDASQVLPVGRLTERAYVDRYLLSQAALCRERRG